MGIVQNIPRKNGRVMTPHQNGRGVMVFGPRGGQTSNVGDATSPVLNSKRLANGLDFNNQISSTGGNVNPLGRNRSVATQLEYPALVPGHTTQLTTIHQSVDVGPHEKGTFFAQNNPAKTLPVRQSGGVDPKSDTAFHPSKYQPVNRPRRYPSQAGERTTAQSFTSSKHLVGVGGTPAAGGRWSIIKRSASDAPVMGGQAHPVGPTVGTGGTGRTSTKGHKDTKVVDNAHSGSPVGLPWLAQSILPGARPGKQTTERGNTFPSALASSNNG